MSDQIAVVSVVIFNVSKQLNSWGLFCCLTEALFTMLL